MEQSVKRARFEALRGYGCVCCRLRQMATGLRIEVHHLVDGGYREHSGGDEATIPLCEWHHRGVPRELAMGKRMMTAIYGPALSEGRRTFVAHWGTERELLDLVNREVYGEAGSAQSLGGEPEG